MSGDNEHGIGYGFIPLYKNLDMDNNYNENENDIQLLVNWDYDRVLFEGSYSLYEKYDWLSNMWECPQLYEMTLGATNINGQSESTYTIFQFSNDFNAATVKDYNQLSKEHNYRTVLYTVIDSDIASLVDDSDSDSSTIIFDSTSDFLQFDGSSRYYAADYGKLLVCDIYGYDKISTDVVFGWIDEDKSNQSEYDSLWNGVQSIPRNVTLCTDSDSDSDSVVLCKNPINNIELLRNSTNILYYDRREFSVNDSDIGGNLEIDAIITTDMIKQNILFDIFNSNIKNGITVLDRTFDIEMNIEMNVGNNVNTDGILWFCLYVEPTMLLEYTCIKLDFLNYQLSINRTNSSILSKIVVQTDSINETYVETYQESVNFTNGMINDISKLNSNSIQSLNYDLRILCDESVVEVFLNNGKIALTARLYPYYNQSIFFSEPVFIFDSTSDKRINGSSFNDSSLMIDYEIVNNIDFSIETTIYKMNRAQIKYYNESNRNSGANGNGGGGGSDVDDLSVDYLIASLSGAVIVITGCTTYACCVFKKQRQMRNKWKKEELLNEEKEHDSDSQSDDE